MPAVVAINHFATDTEAEIEAVKEIAAHHGVEAIVATHWADGGAGAEALAERVAALADADTGQFAPLYDGELSLFEKINTDRHPHLPGRRGDRRFGRPQPAPSVGERGLWRPADLHRQDPVQLLDRPGPARRAEHHVVPVREVRLAAGAGFVVAVCGDIMTMPGLPSVPSAEGMFVDENGLIEGLS